MLSVYFENIEKIIIQQIATSKKKIFVAVAWFTNHVLFEELILAKKRNIEVKILILDDILNRNEFGLNFGLLAINGADIRLANSNEGTMHNKFCIIDEKVITGSYNWTYHANKNHENIVITDEPIVVKNYYNQFDVIFSAAAPIILPYEHLQWTSIKEGDFSELLRNIFREIVAQDDINKDLRQTKLKKLNKAYLSGNAEELKLASQLPITRNFKTITEVLISRYHDFAFKLWEENSSGKPLALYNIDGYIHLGKWIYLPLEIENENGCEYIKGELKTYGTRGDFFAGGLNLSIFDKDFVATIKHFVDGNTRSLELYQLIPENILCIEKAQLFFYKFPSPMLNNNQPRQYRNNSPRLICGINVFGIAKDSDGEIIKFYEGWDPHKKGLEIQKKLFTT